MMMLTKQKPYRSKHFLQFVRNLSCLISGRRSGDNEEVVPHHLETGGTGTKGSDLWTVPLLHRYHQELHAIGRTAFEQKYHVDLALASKLIAHLYIQHLEEKLYAK